MHVAREHRHKVLIRATMRADGPQRDICIRDISSRGLMVQASTAPARGTYVEIVAEERVIVGRVIWAKDRRFGILTRERVDVAAIIRRIPAAPERFSPAARYAKPAAAAARRGAGSNRTLGSALEFALILAFAAALAAALVSAAYQSISRPLENVSTHLGGSSQAIR